MKKTVKFAGLLLCSALGFVACESKDVSGNQKTNVLLVEPSAPIAFNATGNEQRTLTVTTDAKDWDYTASEWVEAEKNGEVLLVGVKDNQAEESRSGEIKFTAGNAEPVVVKIMQAGEKHVLSVEPSTPIAFKAAGNESVTLTVTTNVEDWTFEVPEWITAEKAGNTLVVSVEDNEVEEVKNGSITFKAGNAEPVVIAVSQEAKEVHNLSVEPVDAIEFEATDSKSVTFTVTTNVDGWAYEVPSWVKATKSGNTLVVSAGNNMTANPKNGIIKFTAGEAEPVEIIVSQKANMQIKEKPIKQMVAFQINETNPLNALEYKLSDGSYFFDAVVLFSGNICWYPEQDRVAFNSRQGEPVCNKNIDFLIANSETYIKPLHDAGIKVYMGITPYHTRASIISLSYNGCRDFAEEMAELVRDNYLDGVFLDQEYVGDHGGPMSEYWSSPRAGGSYFAYQMKKQMKNIVPWPTEVVAYEVGLESFSVVTDHEDHSEHTQKEYLDVVVPDYAQYIYPGEKYGDLTRKNMASESVELNLRKGYVDFLSDGPDEGFGWVFYFAFNPVKAEGENVMDENLDRGMENFEQAAENWFDYDVMRPTGYYKWIKDNPDETCAVRHEF